MKKKAQIILVLVLLISLTLPQTVLAQTEGETETFDSAELTGWETSPETAVVDGVLQISPGQFALRFGDYSDIDLQFDLRYSPPGEVIIHYCFRDDSHYKVIMLPDHGILLRFENGSESELGHFDFESSLTDTWIKLRITVISSQHSISLNGETVLTISDENPLSAGAVMLHAIGENGAEIDNFSISGTQVGGDEPMQGEEPFVDGEPDGEGEPPMEGEPPVEGEPPYEEPVGEEPGMDGDSVPPAVTSEPDSLFDEFFSSQASNLNLMTFGINLLLAVVASYILSLVYIHWGTSLSNRRKFAANFMLMTITTTFIILVVRSSIALSLGLVGALSIVRFRAAIKEPEELAYLFFAIGLGIGLGDNQRLITLLALAVAVLVLGLMKLFRNTRADVNLHLTVSSHNPHKVIMDEMTSVLDKHCSKVKLMRFDENNQTLEAGFLVELRKVSDLNRVSADLKNLSENVEITFLDNKGIW